MSDLPFVFELFVFLPYAVLGLCLCYFCSQQDWCVFLGVTMDRYLAGLMGALTSVRVLNHRADELESTAHATTRSVADHEERLLELEESSLHTSGYYDGEIAQSRV